MEFNSAFKGLTGCQITIHHAKPRHIIILINIQGLSGSEWVCGRPLAGTAGSNPAEAWRSVCCECCVLLGRDLCDGLITRPEESYRL